jgi:probable phosphoglycerate mutase
MTEIILIRHGETDWNVERRIQGHCDIPLNREGERQAAALGRALASESLDAVISSDLQRAMQTARAIAVPHGLSMFADCELRERCFGAFEGLTHEEIRARYPDHYSAWRAREADAQFPAAQHAAETLRDFSSRAVNAVARLAAGNFRTLAIVTHGGVLDCLYRAACGIDLSAPRDFDILNAGINRLLWDGSRFHLLQWGEATHLDVAALDEIR